VIAPNIDLCFLVENLLIKVESFEQAKSINADIGSSGLNAWPWWIRTAHTGNSLFFVYTVDRWHQYVLCLYYGADVIITNRCEMFKSNNGDPF
jgi:hypothetical protein